MKDKSKTLGWNPTYFGEPKKGSLAAVIADVTEKQNAVVGEKPEVQSSAAVQAKEQQDNQEAMNPAQQAAIAIDMKKKGKKPKNESNDSYYARQAAIDKAKSMGKDWDKMGEHEKQALVKPEMLKRGYELIPGTSRFRKKGTMASAKEDLNTEIDLALKFN